MPGLGPGIHELTHASAMRQTCERSSRSNGLVDARPKAWHDEYGCRSVHYRSLQASSVARIWSATRNAWAAIVSAGLTAAEDGMKPASTTNRLGWSKARQ